MVAPEGEPLRDLWRDCLICGGSSCLSMFIRLQHISNLFAVKHRLKIPISDDLQRKKQTKSLGCYSFSFRNNHWTMKCLLVIRDSSWGNVFALTEDETSWDSLTDRLQRKQNFEAPESIEFLYWIFSSVAQLSFPWIFIFHPKQFQFHCRVPLSSSIKIISGEVLQTVSEYRLKCRDN